MFTFNGKIWNPLSPRPWVKYNFYCPSTRMGLVLNYPRRLICHEINKSNQTNMCVWVCVLVRRCVCLRVRLSIYIYIYIYISSTQTHTLTYIYIYIYINICVFECVCAGERIIYTPMIVTLKAKSLISNAVRIMFFFMILILFLLFVGNHHTQKSHL